LTIIGEGAGRFQCVGPADPSLSRLPSARNVAYYRGIEEALGLLPARGVSPAHRELPSVRAARRANLEQTIATTEAETSALVQELHGVTDEAPHCGQAVGVWTTKVTKGTKNAKGDVASGKPAPFRAFRALSPISRSKAFAVPGFYTNMRGG